MINEIITFIEKQILPFIQREVTYFTIISALMGLSIIVYFTIDRIEKHRKKQK